MVLVVVVVVAATEVVADGSVLPKISNRLHALMNMQGGERGVFE